MQKFLTSKALQLLGGAVAFLSFIFHCTTFFFLGKGPKGPSFPLCDLMRHLAKQVYRAILSLLDPHIALQMAKYTRAFFGRPYPL